MLRTITALGGVLAVVSLLVGEGKRFSVSAGGETERWFAPGAWGWEAGKSAPAPGPSAYLTRHVGGLGAPAAVAWARHNHLTDALSFSHNLGGVFPASLYAEHPEYFPEVKGRRVRPVNGAHALNPDLGRADVAAHAAAAARKAFAANPAQVSFALGVNDALLFGESPETLAAVLPQRWFRGRPDYTNLVFGFMNRVAADVARTHPDKLLGALAYYWAENTPDFPVHPQVVPFLTADRSQGYDPEFWRQELTLQKQWAKAGPRRLGLYDYLDGYGFVIPRIHPRFLAESLAHARSIGFTDYYGEAPPNWGIDGPTTWMVAQLLRDPLQNSAALLDEYYRRYFQESAGPMRAFFERCERQWVTQVGPSYWMKHYRNDSQADLFPPEVCRELRLLLDEAGRWARKRKVQERVAMVAESFGVTERYSRLHAVRAALQREVLKGKLAGAAGAERLIAFVEAKEDFLGYSKALTERRPLAFAPIVYGDLLGNDPALAASAVLAKGDPGEMKQAARRLSQWRSVAETGVADGAMLARALESGTAVERLADGGLEGPRNIEKRIAGLPYGIGLPGGWQSGVEPTQAHAAEVTAAAARTGDVGLRVVGAVNTSVYQWLPAKPGHLYVASVRVRGQAGPSDIVNLTFGWADAQGRRVGSPMASRLPEGRWPDWVHLQRGGQAPENSAWVGIGVQLMNQIKGDWAEFDDFSLLEVPVPAPK